ATDGASPAANQPSAGRSVRASHTEIGSASGARLGRIAIAALIARPDARGLRAAARTSASVEKAVTGTSLIAFTSWYRNVGLLATNRAPRSAGGSRPTTCRPSTKVSHTVSAPHIGTTR